jgi:hypothetical protein
MLPIPTRLRKSIAVMLRLFSGPEMPSNEKATVLMNLAKTRAQYLSFVAENGSS